ncbi:hypothetical protein LAN15_23050, partial [Mycobacterium tuberculosis]|nr:hypothetical protein [Mycobacterium tuberculosis]
MYCEAFCFRGNQVNTQQLSIVHRLPQSYRWLAGFAGSRV